MLICLPADSQIFKLGIIPIHRSVNSKHADDVNAQNILHGSCLEGALRYGSLETVRLLLHKGAIATDQAMRAASIHGDEEFQKLIRKALESQAS